MANIYDLSDAWNDAGTTFTAIKMDVTDTASASGSLLMDLQVGGASKFKVNKDGAFSGPSGLSTTYQLQTTTNGLASGTPRILLDPNAFGGVVLSSLGAVIWTDGTTGSTKDLILARDAANTLAQRNGANAQTFNLYNIYAATDNYERGFMRWSSNVLEIGTEKGTAGGSARQLDVIVNGAVGLRLNTNGSTSMGSILTADSGFFDVYGNKTGALTNNVASAKIRLRASTSGAPPYVSVSSDAFYAFASGTSAITNAPDAGLARDSAGVVKVTDGSTGTGELIFIVPTSDPGITGALWNNGGTLAISA